MNTMTDNEFMIKAVEVGKLCSAVPTAFNVGAVITPNDSNKVLATGLSRQHPGNTHAEECALLNLALQAGAEQSLETLRKQEDCSNGLARGCTMYTTMEPCSKRLSGNRSCTSRVIAAGIKRVVVGVSASDRAGKRCVGVDFVVVMSMYHFQVLG